MKTEEVLKKLEEKVLSYVKESLGEEEYDGSLDEKILSYLKSDEEQLDEFLEAEELHPAFAIADDFVAGFWYAVDLLGTADEDFEEEFGV